jgi:hypothetical protein
VAFRSAPIIRPAVCDTGISAKLMLMRWRNSCAWALAGSFAIAVVLVLACQPGFAPAAGAGMSAPVAPRVSVESAPAAKLLPSHFDWYTPPSRFGSHGLAASAIGAANRAKPSVGSATESYGPLHRRPPPSFS